MRRLLLDTNIYVLHRAGEREIVELIASADALFMNPIVLGELMAGFAIGSRERANREGLARFLESPRISVLPLEEQTAVTYAAVFRALRRRGRPIPTNDLWIAASALQHGLVLATRDRHFSEIDGLLTAATVDDLLG